MIKSARLAAAAALVAVALGIGIHAWRTYGPAHDGGALSAQTYGGGTSVDAPRAGTYTYTEGEFMLCRQPGGSGTLRLTGISYDEKLRPKGVEAVIRTIPPISERSGPPEDWEPVISAIGRPGSFRDINVRGRYEPLDGAVISTTCTRSPDDTVAQPELQLVITVPPSGSQIDGFTIHYEIDGGAHELTVPWQMVGCGTRTPRKLCQRTPPR